MQMGQTERYNFLVHIMWLKGVGTVFRVGALTDESRERPL